MAKLKATANPRDAQLNRLDSPHANAWLSARPSCMDGTDTVLPPRIYRTAVARLLGQPVFSSSAPCPLCEQTMDLFGDHSLCCKKSGDRITTQTCGTSYSRSLISASSRPSWRSSVSLARPTSRRPGDVSIKNWSLRRGLATDV